MVILMLQTKKHIEINRYCPLKIFSYISCPNYIKLHCFKGPIHRILVFRSPACHRRPTLSRQRCMSVCTSMFLAYIFLRGPNICVFNLLCPCLTDVLIFSKRNSIIINFMLFSPFWFLDYSIH